LYNVFELKPKQGEKMHISLPHDVFLKALDKGGLAIFGSNNIDDNLRETIPTQRCVKITAKDGSLIVESSVNKANAVYVCKSDSIKIIEDGELCIDAIDLKRNLKALKYAHTVVVEFKKESLNEEAGKNSDSIIPIGKVTFKAVNASGRNAFKLDITAYSPSDFVQTSYSDEIEPVLKIQAKSLADAINFVAFASGSDQMTELFDHICLISKDGDIHVAATDNKRAALSTLDSSVCEGKTDGRPILIETKLASAVMSQMPADATPISIVLDPDDEHITFRTEDLKVRCSMPASSTRTRFPTFSNAINMPVGASVIFEPKKEIEQTISRLGTSSNMGVFTVETGAEEIEIKCWNMDVAGKVGCRKVEKGLDNPMILPLQFIEDIVKKLPVDAIKFSFSKDEKRVIVQSVDSPTPFYLMQRVTPTDV